VLGLGVLGFWSSVLVEFVGFGCFAFVSFGSLEFLVLECCSFGISKHTSHLEPAEHPQWPWP
jgi:hypothetical protein